MLHVAHTHPHEILRSQSRSHTPARLLARSRGHTETFTYLLTTYMTNVKPKTSPRMEVPCASTYLLIRPRACYAVDLGKSRVHCTEEPLQEGESPQVRPMDTLRVKSYR